jgi:hypothetical protein
MKWSVKSYRKKTKKRAREDWHRWFAWRPVTIPEGDELQPAMRIWLEYVERRRLIRDWTERDKEAVDYSEREWEGRTYRTYELCLSKYRYRPDTTRITSGVTK